ncbi:hypothetical protein APHAL10511_000877 [Amanita phalloides]|nr:hypothetical protein APHAL10511_000877 [Amanita phalloides]
MGEGTYYTLNLSTDSLLVSSSLLDEYRLNGVLAALALIHLLVQPNPISPFLLYAACFSNTTCLDRNSEHLLALIPDKQTWFILSAIQSFRNTTVLSPAEAYRHPVASRAIELGLVELDYFHEAREDALHHQLVLCLLATTLLGHTDPWLHRHFLAFSKGFNLKFLGISCLVEPGDSADPENFDFQSQFFTTIYGSRICGPSNVLDHLVIKGEMREKKEEVLFKLFVLRLRRWLHGLGHPTELVGEFFSQHEYHASLQVGPAFRSILLWKSMTDLEVLPVVGMMQALICLKYIPEKELGQTSLNVAVHACVMDMDVVIDQFVANMLLEPGNLDNTQSTVFDLWWHPQILGLAGKFNTL